MPIYEYACEKCGEVFEEFQSITAPPLRKCKSCGSGPVRKLVSNSSFILKGSGWYVTDYARKNLGLKEKKAHGDSKGDTKQSDSAKSKSSESHAAT